MQVVLLSIWHSPIAHGALEGLVAAALVDFHAFLTWKNWADLKNYDWGTASFRWFVGLVSGAATAMGLSGMGA